MEPAARKVGGASPSIFPAFTARVPRRVPVAEWWQDSTNDQGIRRWPVLNRYVWQSSAFVSGTGAGLEACSNFPSSSRAHVAEALASWLVTTKPLAI